MSRLVQCKNPQCNHTWEYKGKHKDTPIEELTIQNVYCSMCGYRYRLKSMLIYKKEEAE